jgi:hypothetical protein
MLTSDEYAERSGLCCPSCHGDSLYSGPFYTRDDMRVAIDVKCGDCYAEWSDVYDLIGYEDLETKESAQ